MSAIDLPAVRAYLEGLQDRLCEALEEQDSEARFSRQEIAAPGGGNSRPRILADGEAIEKAAVSFTHSVGPHLPPAATERRPELAGRGFEAVALSAIVHPRNPYAPTSHCNLRFFCAGGASQDPVWWFGGGFDLTPYYGFEDDAVRWHRAAREACRPFGEDLYPILKRSCDEYFYLPHRDEPRGIGGLFFDDLDEGGFERCFAFARGVGEQYRSAYLPILAERKGHAYGERERAFQLYRRGRYAEFNLIVDRGTRYGLQSGRRIESVLASLPPLAAWRYDWRPAPGSPEARLYDDFLRPRDWLSEAEPPS
ncbi:MAG: oxygen-dependent coproporphyrinogen oxidase [Proteobacteria bacterium]|nr:oxygen-dependent coproporphyrinogen oxidase [Pseudomonadota bacterium]